MKNLLIVVSVCLALAGALNATAQIAGDGPALLKISEHVYAYAGITNASPASGFGANTGVVIGKDAVAVVDTLISAKAAERLLGQIRAITDKPVRYVINTHAHLDHAWGNCVFAAQGAVIIGQQKTRGEMLAPANGLARAKVYGLSDEMLAGTVITPPAITFDKTLSVDLGGVAVQLDCPGPSHTAGSTVAFVPEDKVLFTGDILFTGYHPNISSGELESWRRILAELQKTPANVIVPGHGPLSTVKDLGEMSEYIRVFDTEAKRLCAGKTAADAPAIARELEPLLPAQHRTELPFMVRANLSARYLPKP
jgi:cyclase